jgi:bifunctional non-homologous end joining protein LigD
MMKIPKPMLPTLSYDFPKGQDWVYEIKYDGFRAIFYIDHHTFHFISRNGLSLTEQFPEVEEAVQFIREVWKHELPLMFDGELCILESKHKASFEEIQLRGRLKSKDKVINQMTNNRAYYCIFDLLMKKQQIVTGQTYKERKHQLEQLFVNAELPLEVQPHSSVFVQYIKNYNNKDEAWKLAERFDAEGIIASIYI